ncbi:MAG TPA: phosphosulfolactate synthase [Acidimicrobiales bacterium]|nr:phosphosulfolactate synthase [Acidimicrobiales bacterium]
MQTSDLLRTLGVPELPRATSPFDPGYDPVTVIAHLAQSGHLMSRLKLSMACWIIADEQATRQKIAAAKDVGVPTVTGGGPFEVAAAQGCLDEYLDVCASMGFDRIECGEGFTDLQGDPASLVRRAGERGLEVQFELGKKHGGAFDDATVTAMVDQARSWIDAGAAEVVVEARENARAVGLFDGDGHLQAGFAERFVEALGMERVVFEAPDKPSQFAFLAHFGPRVQLSNVRLEELLRVEIYRRGLHSDSFANPRLRPAR